MGRKEGRKLEGGEREGSKEMKEESKTEERQGVSGRGVWRDIGQIEWSRWANERASNSG